MNRFLRTAPTRRVLEALGGAILLIAVGAAIAIAATNIGPVPRREPLAVAVHQALVARAPAGITARVNFTNNLIDASELQGSDPLLSGATGRLWLSPGALRLELQGDNGDANLVVRGRSVWAYDPMSNTVYEATLPASRAHAGGQAGADRLPPVAAIQTQLRHLTAHLRISGARPGDIAGRPEYTVRVAPRSSAGLLGAAELAWDAIRGVPLRFSLFARGDSSPVLSLAVSHISYGRVGASAFSISPPAGAKVVNLSGGGSAPRQVRVPFRLAAPASLAGLRRTAVRRLGAHGALVLYGRPLGGVAVLETPASPGATTRLAAAPSGDGPGLNLPTVRIGGVTAQEIQTALGTVLRFSRGGVQYTVLGFVAPRVVDAAASGL